MSESGRDTPGVSRCSLRSCFIARSLDAVVILIVWLSCRLVELLEKRENGEEWQQQKTKGGRDEGALMIPSGQIFIDEVLLHCCCPGPSCDIVLVVDIMSL